MLGNATRICEASFGYLFLREGPTHTARLQCMASPIMSPYRRHQPVIAHARQSEGMPLERLTRTKNKSCT